MFSRSRFGQKSLCTGCGDLFCGLQWEWFKRTPCLLNQVSIAQNLSRICSNGLFFRKFLSQHFRGLSFGFRALHSAQKHFRKLSRTLISPAFANCPELSQAFANKQFARSFADLSRLHVLLSRRHYTLSSLQIVTIHLVFLEVCLFWTHPQIQKSHG